MRYPLAELGGRAWYALSVPQRRHAIRNYAAVLGLPESDPRVARTARRAFEGYGEMLADFLLLGRLSKEELVSRVTHDGHESIAASLQACRGCIMALPHMGSWDVAGSYAAAVGYPIVAVAERFPGSLDTAVVEARTRFGLEVIPLGRAAVREVSRALRENKLVAMVCDLPPPGGGGVPVRFFGRRALVPSGPAAFAVRMGTPIVAAGIYRIAPGRYHVSVGEPIPVPEGGGKEAVVPLMQRVVEHFETYIRRCPEQWYAFKRVLAEPVR